VASFLSSKKNAFISTEDLKQGFKKWERNIASNPVKIVDVASDPFNPITNAVTDEVLIRSLLFLFLDLILFSPVSLRRFLELCNNSILRTLQQEAFFPFLPSFSKSSLSTRSFHDCALCLFLNSLT
jgi:hypothetical protein